jgi:hypothetical protein
MQWEPEKRETAYLGKERGRLGLRGHARAERFAAGYQRFRRCEAAGLLDCGTHGRVTDCGRIGSLAAFLHVRKLISQARDTARRELSGHGLHEGVVHARTGPMREHEGRARVRRLLP